MMYFFFLKIIQIWFFFTFYERILQNSYFKCIFKKYPLVKRKYNFSPKGMIHK